MKTRNLLTFLIILLTFTFASACGDDTNDAVQSTGFADSQIILDYADEVVVPTYELLDTRAGEMQVAVDALAAAPTDANLTAAKKAWVDMRLPWEQSEGMLFGPVDTNGYDPAMDSWPLNKTDLDGVLAGEATLDQPYVKSLGENLKGFHTIEYLLFGEANDKVAEDLTPRELEYLKATTAEMVRITGLLAKSWTVGVDGNQAYRDVFVTAGEPGNDKFPSQSAAAQQIVAGIVGILQEVGEGKIGGPFEARDTTLVESQFSFNSLQDFTDNLKSVQNSYMGRVPEAGTSGKGLNQYVAAQDAELNARVEAEIEAAIAALGEIPPPFRDAVLSDDAQVRAKIQAAIDAIATLEATFQTDVLELL
ncbi:imelysin family protein [Bradymonas sediminis]|nr:imelysin family protein [Bradymonas sediminis]TDP73778.1 putative iron-regulated protein [Bradymonas sediminis]